MRRLRSISQLNGQKRMVAILLGLVPAGRRMRAQRAGESVRALMVEMQSATHMVTENWV